MVGNHIHVQSVSRSLASLERSVGVALVQRTTRQSQPTEAGLAFYNRVKPAFAEINDAKSEAADRSGEPSGLLRISAPALFATAYVTPTICDFMERHPKVEVDLKASDRPVNLLDEGLDMAVRIRELPDSTLKVRRLGALRIVVFGAPAYFAKNGRPQHPRDLSQHQCVVRITDGEPEAWPFRIDGRRKTVRVYGPFRTDSTPAMLAAVARGLGIGLAPLWQIRGLVDQGVVEVVLEDFEAARLPIYAVLPPTRTPHTKTRLFIDLLAAQLKGEYL